MKCFILTALCIAVVSAQYYGTGVHLDNRQDGGYGGEHHGSYGGGQSGGYGEGYGGHHRGVRSVSRQENDGQSGARVGTSHGRRSSSVEYVNEQNTGHSSGHGHRHARSLIEAYGGHRHAGYSDIGIGASQGGYTSGAAVVTGYGTGYGSGHGHRYAGSLIGAHDGHLDGGYSGASPVGHFSGHTGYSSHVEQLRGSSGGYHH